MNVYGDDIILKAGPSPCRFRSVSNFAVCLARLIQSYTPPLLSSPSATNMTTLEDYQRVLKEAEDQYEKIKEFYPGFGFQQWASVNV